MSKNLKNTSKTRSEKVKLNKPFDPKILEESQKLARGYHLVLEEHEELGFTASCIEIPTAFSDGESADECVKAIRKALSYAVATMIECGDTPPQPFVEKKRDFQVNVRLTFEEKMLLSRMSKSRGFKGLSDFMRSSVLDHIHCTI